MKKLNKKGFTLIELLAVIVILAIIVVVTVPTIIKTIADARVQSIWNLAGEVANSYDTAVAQELLTENVLKGANATTSWECINNIKTTDKTQTLAEILELKAKDVKFGGNVPTDNNGKIVVGAGTCSAIRLKSTGGAEVVLVAEADGKFYVSGKTVVYAISSEANGVAVEPSV